MTGFLKECCLDQVWSKIILLWLFIDLDDRGLVLSLASWTETVENHIAFDFE